MTAKYTAIVIFLPFLTLLQSTAGWNVGSVPVQSVPLRRDDPDSPFCLVASTTSFQNLSTNFLATQVWPSARLAAAAIEKHLNQSWTVCELGCGPGLPSLTAAKVGAEKVMATDLDTLALELVKEAAVKQGLTNVETRHFDITARDESLPVADLYIMSDVFESNNVARGAAFLTDKALQDGARVWVFAQTDRAQREEYLKELCKLRGLGLSWNTIDDFDDSKHLWLCDVDEGTVNYG